MEENIVMINPTTTRIDDDRISQLPESIAHHILSLLDSPADLLRMTVLSNYWFALTASFPILDFDLITFIRALRTCGKPSDSNNDIEYVRDNFYKYLEYTTCRFCQQNLTSAHTFKLFTRFIRPTELELDTVNRCVGFILRKGVRELVIYFRDCQYVDNTPPVYCVPDIHLSASSLTSLTLDCYRLSSSFMIADGVKLKSLKRLNLYNLHIDEEVIKRLTNTCPLLEKINVQYCYGFKTFCIYGHQNLRKVQIFFNHELERIDIEALNLWFLSLTDMEKRGTPFLNLLSYKKLTKLCYNGYPSPSFSSNFPFLEDLSLSLPRECKKLKLSSDSLKKFVLQNVYYCLEEMDINTPNLLLLGFMGCLPINTIWFQQLRRLLDKKIRFKELKLEIYAKDLIDIEELKLTKWQPLELEHVDLKPIFIKKLSVYVAVVEAVIWCCRPQSLTLESSFLCISFEECNQLVKFTYEKLLEQENESETNIKIVLSSSSKPKKYFRNLTSLLTALSSDRLTQTITFIKEEVIKKR